MDMPEDRVDAVAVDESGRIRLPSTLQTALAVQKEWFVKLSDNEQSLQIGRAATGGQRVELDANGRMHFPPSLIDKFAGRTVVHLHCLGDQLFVMIDDTQNVRSGFDGRPPAVDVSRVENKLSDDIDCGRKGR